MVEVCFVYASQGAERGEKLMMLENPQTLKGLMTKKITQKKKKIVFGKYKLLQENVTK